MEITASQAEAPEASRTPEAPDVAGDGSRDAAVEESPRGGEPEQGREEGESVPAEEPIESSGGPEAGGQPAEEASGEAPGAEPGGAEVEETGAEAHVENGEGAETADVAGAETGDEAGAETGDDAEAPDRRGPGEAKSDEELLTEASALLFASAEPLSEGRLTRLLDRPDPARVRALLAELGERLEGSPVPFVLRRIAGGWRLLTDPSQGEVVSRLKKEKKPERITAAALETLAIVAYRQPVTKAEVEAIRGVQAGPMLRTLVDRRLIRVTGRADLPGSPLQYGTTREFLDRFGLGSVGDLPRDGELTEG